MTSRRKNLRPVVGTILVASPLMARPEYKQIVILLIRKDTYGNMYGLALNRPGCVLVSELAPELEYCRFRARSGGPREETELSVIHTLGITLPKSELLVHGPFSLNGDLDKLASLLDTHKVHSRDCVFVYGFFRWFADDFQKELLEKNWYVIEATHDVVFTDQPETLWKKIIDSFGDNQTIVAQNINRLSLRN